MTIQIAFHGGHCCGIKTIHSFYNHPSYKLPPKDETENLCHYDREGYGPDESSADFFWPERPAETASERFNAQIEFLEKVRHYGLVECCVTVPLPSGQTAASLSGETAEWLEAGLIPTYEEAVQVARARGVLAKEAYEDDEYNQDFYEDGQSYDQSEWVPVFEKHGFRMVSEFPNINSGNLIRVYHLTMDGAYYKSKKEK